MNQLRDGDYRPDGAGDFLQSTGAQEALDRALFLLTVRRGSFALLPELGSRLDRLAQERSSAREAMGASYAAEALAGEEDLEVTGAAWEESSRQLTVFLNWKGEHLSAAVTL
ncbi:MAG: hypothetical protein HFF00_00545 [Ruminiclostridium sp.]|jgi:hypothetical protein|nr:hypothetical protein [Ruminiclostridium sp.]